MSNIGGHFGSFPFHRRSLAPGRSPKQSGYVLLAIVATLAAMAVAMYRIIPQYAFQAQRDKEEELIFRGEAYRQAIQFYVRKFGRYPNSLDELVNTNNIRFIRKLYQDPMTEDGEWRLIHMGPGGTFPDSKLLGTGGGSATTGLPPSAMQLGSAGDKDITEQGSSDRPNPDRPASTLGGAIAGVASYSEEKSIRIWNEQDSYDKWEFIYNFRNDPIAMGGPLGQQLQGGQGGQPQGAGSPPQVGGPQPLPGNQPPGFPTVPPGQGSPFGGGGNFPGRGAPIGIRPVPGQGASPSQPDPNRRF